MFKYAIPAQAELEAEDIFHEIDPSSPYGEKKANYTRFFIGNEKHG